MLHARMAESMAQGTFELPLFPETASRVLTTCESPDCDASHLASLLEQDPALAGNVLRVANSAAYAPAEPILSLSQAVSRLGFGAVCSISTALALQGEVFDVPGHEERLGRMWRHSTLSGSWSKEIARQRRRNVEGAFLCGLLHDIGRPVLLRLFVNASRDAEVQLGAEELDGLLRDGHEELGERILREWRLPAWTAAAARYHHDPGQATSCLEEVHTTALGHSLARWSEAPADPELDAELRAHPSLERLGIYPDELSALLELRERVEQAAEGFQ